MEKDFTRENKGKAHQIWLRKTKTPTNKFKGPKKGNSQKKK